MLGAMDDRDYGRHRDAVEDQYRADRDKAADAQWQAEFDEAVRQFNFANKLGEFAPTASAKKSGTPNPEDDETLSSFEQVRQDYIDGTTAAMTDTEREGILESAVAGGSITKAQADAIRRIYHKPTQGYTAADKIWDRNG